jgi:hypothetical protein
MPDQIHHTDERSYVDIGSPLRITNDASSKSVAVPTYAEAFICFAEGGDCRLEIGGAASATSTIFVAENSMIVYPIKGSTQTLYCYGIVSTYGNFRFLATE